MQVWHDEANGGAWGCIFHGKVGGTSGVHFHSIWLHDGDARCCCLTAQGVTFVGGKVDGASSVGNGMMVVECCIGIDQDGFVQKVWLISHIF